MHFELPDDLTALAETAAALARDRFAADALRRARTPSFPRGVSGVLAGEGLTGLVRSKCARAAAGVLAGVVAVEAIARVCPRSGDAIHGVNFAAALHLACHAANADQETELAALLDGQRLFSIAVSEEGAGAQAGALVTRARREGGEIVLSGSKRFAANSDDADGFIVYARFGETIEEIGAILVPRGTPGLVLGDPISVMSGDSWRSLTFNDARLPESAVIFARGGFSGKAGFFDIEKIGNAARALGVGWCAFDSMKEFALRRQQFGRPIAEFQGLQWKVADVALALEAAQLVLYRAAARADAGCLRGEDSSCAKTMCNRAAMGACDAAVQVLAGAGYSGDSLVEYCFRKARGFMINGGVVDLMLTRIAEGVFDLKFPQQRTN